MNYTPEIIILLQQEYNITKSCEELAEDFNVPFKALSNAISRLRAKGFVFASKGLPIGHTRTRTRKDGSIDIRVKTLSGWEYKSNGNPRFGGDNSYPIGAISVRKRQGGTVTYVKTAEGWKYQCCSLDSPKKRGGYRERVKEPKQKAQPRDIVRSPRAKAKLYDPTKNPAVVKISSDAEKIEKGYRYVYDPHLRAMALRMPVQQAAQ